MEKRQPLMNLQSYDGGGGGDDDDGVSNGSFLSARCWLMVLQRVRLQPPLSKIRFQIG